MKKIINLIVLVTFLFTNTAYSAPPTSTLRVPLGASKRVEETIDALKEAQAGTKSFPAKSLKTARDNRTKSGSDTPSRTPRRTKTALLSLLIISPLSLAAPLEAKAALHSPVPISPVGVETAVGTQSEQEAILQALAHIKKASDYAELGQYSKAISETTKAIELNTGQTELFYHFRGTFYAFLDQHSEAISDFDKAIELNPKDAMFYRSRGFSHYDSGQIPKAISDFTKAIELDPQNSDIYSTYLQEARALLQKFEEAKAKATTKEATEEKSLSQQGKKAIEQAKTHNYQGATWAYLGQSSQAISEFTKAIEIDPEFARAYYNRGRFYYGSGQYSKAISDFNRTIELNPEYADAYFRRGGAYYLLGEYDQALSDYSKAIELNPKNAMAYVNRVSIYRKLGRYDQAVADLNKAIELNPDHNLELDYYIYNYRGLSYFGLGQYEQAVSDYTKAIELDPKNAEAYYNRGISHRALRQYPQAISDLTKAIELDPENAAEYKDIIKTIKKLQSELKRKKDQTLELIGVLKNNPARTAN